MDKDTAKFDNYKITSIKINNADLKFKLEKLFKEFNYPEIPTIIDDYVRKHNDLDKIRLARLLYYKAIAYQYDGKYSISKKVLLKAIEVDSTNWDILNKLGDILFELGEYDQAMKYYRKVHRDVTKNKYGTSDIEVTKSYNNLGKIYFKKGLFITANEFFNKSLKNNLKTLGEKHSEVAKNYINLGLVCRDSGDFDDAIRYFKLALKINLKVFGKKNTKVASDYDNIGYTYMKIGKYSSAINYFHKALKIDFKIFGKEHLNIASLYDIIGEIYSLNHDYSKAVKYSVLSIKIKLKEYGNEHKEVARHYHKIGKLLYSKGETEKAIKLIKKALNIMEKIYPDGNPKIDIIKNELEKIK